MPLPARVSQGQGEFLVDGQFGIAFEGFSEPRLFRARERFLETLFHETGIVFSREVAGTSNSGTARFLIQTAGPSAAIQQLGEDESYQLSVSSDGVRLKAANPLGVMHG